MTIVGEFSRSISGLPGLWQAQHRNPAVVSPRGIVPRWNAWIPRADRIKDLRGWGAVGKHHLLWAHP